MSRTLAGVSRRVLPCIDYGRRDIAPLHIAGGCPFTQSTARRLAICILAVLFGFRPLAQPREAPPPRNFAQVRSAAFLGRCVLGPAGFVFCFLLGCGTKVPCGVSFALGQLAQSPDPSLRAAFPAGPLASPLPSPVCAALSTVTGRQQTQTEDDVYDGSAEAEFGP